MQWGGCFNRIVGTGDVHRQSGCKAWLLVLLDAMTPAYRSGPDERTKVLQARTRSARIHPVLDHLQPGRPAADSSCSTDVRHELGLVLPHVQAGHRMESRGPTSAKRVDCRPSRSHHCIRHVGR